MSDSNPQRVVINEAEVRSAAAFAEARFTDPERETERLGLAREFLTRAFALERAVHAHSRCALVNHCGSRGSNNLTEATDTLFEAISGYAASIRVLSARFQGMGSPSESANDNDDDARRSPRLAIAP